MAKGWKHFKIKVGLNLEQDVKRLEIIRNTIGDDCFIMVDANQQWSVNQSIKHINAYKKKEYVGSQNIHAPIITL